MADLLDAVDDTIVAIMEQARGASGLGAFAAACALPLRAYRRSPDRMAMDDPYPPGEEFDRAYEVRYDSIADMPGAAPSNPYDPQSLRELVVTLRVGLYYGADIPRFVSTWPSSTETQAYAVLNARKRALEDADRVWRAFNCPDISRRTDTDPQLADWRRDGPVTLQDIGGGRLLYEMVLKVWIAKSNSTSYVPSR